MTNATFSRIVRHAWPGEIRAALLDTLTGLRDDGHTLAGYGAPAKGNTMLPRKKKNYCP